MDVNQGQLQNSSIKFFGIQLSFKNWWFFYYSCINHGVRPNSLSENIIIKRFMGLDLILYWKTHNYQNVILMNLELSWCAWWPIFLLLVLFKIYFKSLFLRFEIFSGKTLSVIPVFTTLNLLLLFQIIKICQCCGFTFTNFFLQPPMSLQQVE